MSKNRTIIYLAGFLFSIPLALTSYINSSFLENYINKNYIGIIYVIASLFTIFGLLKMPKILNRIGNRSTALYFGIIIFISLLLLAFGKSAFFVLPAFILYFFSSNFIIASLDIFIEDFSKNSNIGKFRGIYLTIINGAWIVAQLISGSIIAKSSFKGIYLFSAIFIALFSFLFILFLHNFKDPEYKKMSVLKTLKFFIKNRAISKIYLIYFLLRFFYAWMVIYTPIYLHEYLGFGWSQIGIIFTIMLIPFVILDYPLGKLSDKIGEKKMLIIGFFINIIFTLLIPLISEPRVWIWAIILFGTRVGSATIEAMSEIYFFKKIDAENSEAISFFRNTYSLSFVIAPIIATPILFLIPSFKYLFFILGAIMLVGLLISYRIRDIK